MAAKSLCVMFSQSCNLRLLLISFVPSLLVLLISFVPSLLVTIMLLLPGQQVCVSRGLG